MDELLRVPKNIIPYLEDHPMTCKWLITMVIVSPLRIGLWDPFQMAFSWLINPGDPNHLLTGMILQVGFKQHARWFQIFFIFIPIWGDDPI